ncbi:MAG TPA: hypothetical protein VNA14_13035 [Mycobacteriales bacterium]|nr:hypothetical protein [Mycobacteriales bacterium]
MRRAALITLALVGTALVATETPGAAAPTGAFSKPLRLTEPDFGGYEPSIRVDRHGNVFVTAHKTNDTVVVGKDADGPVPVRGASYLWHSADGGTTFGPLPGLTALRENSLWPAAEGDLAVDGADHLYFVDTYAGDNSISRWTMGGRGEITADWSRPVQGTASVDDRPWISAHGNGVVMYLGNAGASPTADGLPASGRYTVYMSYDGGMTFDTVGVNLPDSGWCHGAADPRAKSTRLYVLCSNDSGTLYAYSSADDGRSFKRTEIGKYVSMDSNTWPAVTVGRDGTVHALFNILPIDAADEIGTRLIDFSSTDGGATWRRTDLTPRTGFHHYSWLDVASDGTLGVAYYFRPEEGEPWVLYAGTARPGRRLRTTAIAQVADATKSRPHGDFFQIAFGPDRKLHVAYTGWTDSDLALGGPEIFYVRQR